MTLYERSGEDIDRGLVGYWKLDDLKTENSSGIAIGRATFNDGNINSIGAGVENAEGINGLNPNAMDFDGSGDVTIPNSDNINISQIITVSLWVRPDAPTESDLLSKGIGLNGYVIWYSNGGDRTATFGKQGDAATQVKTTTTFLTKWAHIVGTYDGITMKIYRDGILHESKAVSTTFTNSGSLLLAFGADGNFDGRLQNVRIYNRALSSGEANKLYRLKL